ncbi:MAG: ribonuclease HI family protein [Candidatus Firestonebacteria bacterium]|nr:ribonuclease HI family protein [Candidatus Firestonebacteria bacterium]
MKTSPGALFCDGGSRGNPGPSAAGAVLYKEDGGVLEGRGKYLGITTNNWAEYQGVLLGLELARQHSLTRLKIHLDSELVVRQLNGQYRVKDAKLRLLWEDVQQALKHFTACEIVHIPRAQNAAADRLVNEALDRHLS